MTLLVTEIMHHLDPAQAIIVFAADRRISWGGRAEKSEQKIFEIPRLNALIGYYGAAEVTVSSKSIAMSEWLPDFIGQAENGITLGELAEKLSGAMNLVGNDWRKTSRSGFHLAGFLEGRPEFWSISNVADDQSVRGEFHAREDFQRQDAALLGPGKYQIYRNGDLRAHVSAWDQLDKSLGQLLKQPDFRPLTTPENYREWVRFKMEVICNFYERFALKSIIGRPVDVFCITAR